MRRAALAAATLALCVAPASAHLRFPELKGERWLDLYLDQPRLRVGYKVGFSSSIADELRRAADGDGDHEVSALEGNRALDARTADLLAHLRVCTGRTLADVTCRTVERREVERVEADGWTPGPGGHLHFIWTLALRERVADLGAVRLEDDYEPAALEITEVRIVPTAARPLTLAGDGDRHAGVATEFTWIERQRAAGPRRIVAVWQPPPAAFRRWLPLALALVAFALFVLSRRLRRNAPGPR